MSSPLRRIAFALRIVSVHVILMGAANAQLTITDEDAHISAWNIPELANVCRAGDFNGDGIDDFAVSAPGADQWDLGAVYILSGSVSPTINPTQLYVFPGRTWACIDIDGHVVSGGDRIGVDIDFAGDLNSDGFGDLLVCAPHVCPYDPYTGGASGRFYVLYGNADDGTLEWSCLESMGTTIGYGKYAAAGGDYNNDGISDFLMYRSNNWNAGSFTDLYAGKAVDLSTAGGDGSIAWPFTVLRSHLRVRPGDDNLCNLGHIDGATTLGTEYAACSNSVAVVYQASPGTSTIRGPGSVGPLAGPVDFDGDGLNDVIVPDVLYSLITVFKGATDYFSGPTPLVTISRPTDATSYWGFSIACLGNIDNRPGDEIAVADRYFASGIGEGRIFIYSYYDGAVDTLLKIDGRAQFAQGVFAAGDLNYDSFNDLLVLAGGIGPYDPMRALVFPLSPDSDADGVMDVYDNCPGLSNPMQTDADDDGYGYSPIPLQWDVCDCDDEDPLQNPETVWFVDSDDDGYGSPSAPLNQCQEPGGHVLNDDDCDDADAAISPLTLWYVDADQDGYGASGSAPVGPQCVSPAPIGYWAPNDATDCDDYDPGVGPLYWYADPDGDGYGTPGDPLASCTQPPGTVDNALDNCPEHYNPDQIDGDADGMGDLCDSLIITAYSPVDIVVYNPSHEDSIGPGFNTFGPNAVYDSLHDYGLGPNGIPGELDDRVVIIAPEIGVFTIKIIPEIDASSYDNYFLGIRDPGGNCYGIRDPGGNVVNETYIATAGASAPYVCDTPVANPVPEQGQCVSLLVAVCAERRGDMNDDHVFDVVDVVGVIGVAFRGVPPPAMSFVADVNSDEVISDVVDVVRIIGHVFRGQPPPGP